MCPPTAVLCTYEFSSLREIACSQIESEKFQSRSHLLLWNNKHDGLLLLRLHVYEAGGACMLVDGSGNKTCGRRYNSAHIWRRRLRRLCLTITEGKRAYEYDQKGSTHRQQNLPELRAACRRRRRGSSTLVKIE
jgi:hypothetical protein